HHISSKLYLCPKSGKLDLNTLEKCLDCLQKLNARNYSLTCQDDSTIICDIKIGLDKLEDEYMGIRSLLNKIF
ncbi:MAG: hypothetical protein QXL89_07135, partial [Nitrososphaeria archaeon]